MALPRKPQAVVFDMDGLIFDTEVLYRDAVMAAARESGVELPLAVYLGTIGLSGPAGRALLGRHFGGGFDLEAFWASASRQFRLMADTELRLKPGVVELLGLLRVACLPCAVATSSSHSDVQHHLTAHGLLDHFTVIVARGDYTQGKPDPEPFLTAAEKLGVAPKLCVALEDSHNGIRAASSAGMMTIMVPDLVEPTEEIRQLCVHVAADLHEVCGIIGLVGGGVGGASIPAPEA